MRSNISLTVLLLLAVGCSSQTPVPSPSTTTISVISPTEQGGENIALGSQVTASTELVDFPSAMAIDGSEEDWWSAGDFAPQWIEIRFSGPAGIARIELIPSQSPAGNTVHTIYACDQSGIVTQVKRIEGFTEDGMPIVYRPANPVLDVTCLRIKTEESPSWVAWREIKVFGSLNAEAAATSIIVLPAETPTLIFYNGEVLTMDSNLAVEEAIAIKGDLVLDVGSNEEILAQAGPDTVSIDMQGQTLMPGIVDAHTHVLNDAKEHVGLDLIQAQDLAIENGITTIGDPFITRDFLEQMLTLEENGQLQLRTSLYLIYTDNCGRLQGNWWREFPPTREFGEMLRIGGVKIFTDGGSCGLPAVSEGPLAGKGDLWFTQDELDAMVLEADKAGYQVILHALGDQAVEEAQNSIEYVLDGKPNTLRHRIDHNAITRPELLERYGEYDIVTSLFGYFIECPYTQTDTFMRENEWRWRDIIDANPDLHVAWHGDFPWVGPINPFLHLHYLVTHEAVQDDGSVCVPQPWAHDQRITVDEALAMMTTGSAYALDRDSEVGSLQAGKLADLILISSNPLTVDPSELKDIKVEMTMIGGETLYCASGFEAFCP